MDPLVRAAIGRDRTIDLTTIGRRSGEPQRIEIWLLDLGARFVVTGTPGPRAWLANVRADPRVVVHVKGGGARADLDASAAEVLDPAVRRSVFEHPAAAWYRDRASLEDLVAVAPMIELVFEGS